MYTDDFPRQYNRLGVHSEGITDPRKRFDGALRHSGDHRPRRSPTAAPAGVPCESGGRTGVPQGVADAAVYPAFQRVRQEARQPRAHGRVLCALVQLRPRSQDAADLSCDGSGNRNSALVDERCCSAHRATRGFSVGLTANRRGLAIFCVYVWFNIRRQATQCCSRYRWDRGTLDPRRAAPKKSNVSLEILISHNIAQLF